MAEVDGGGEAGTDAAQVVVVRTGADAEVAVRGEVDIATTPAFDEALQQVLAAGATTLVLDLADVSFMGSSGLASLLRSQRLLRERGGRLRLRDPSRAVRDLLEMTRLSERFGVDGPAAPPST